MIITDCHKVDRDLNRFAWHRLKLFSNPEFTTDRLVRLHSVPEKHHPNVKKQAHQVRYCLLQAQEYFASATVATLATRPLLLYYATMSLALAEVLVKGTGEKRLEKLRQDHAAHGLSLGVDGPVDRTVPIDTALSRLRARPQTRVGGVRYGTFEVWRGLAREAPVPANIEMVQGDTTVAGFRTVLAAADAPPRSPGVAGYSLRSAMASLPQLQQQLLHMGIPTACARTKLAAQYDGATGRGWFRIVVQPTLQSVREALYDRLIFGADTVNHLEVQELRAGRAITISTSFKDNGRPDLIASTPPAVTIDSDFVHFITNDWDLGEFGAYYVALHIAGNLVRYYPDVWMPHVEHSSALASLVQELCDLAVERLPILAAGELDRVYYFGSA